jgi:hypothetical protein
MRQYSFIGRNHIEYIFVSRRNNPNIEMPSDTPPVPPGDEHGPPVETPPRPGAPEDQPDPPPIIDPDPDEPTRLV